jgi:hypothetical protein
MGRAEELFQQIIEGQEQAIDELIAARASEELYLDFKQIATKPGAKSLHDSDVNNLAKAISGFGNSAGGIIVWGVDCRPGEDGADVPRKKPAADDAAQIRSLIESRLSGLTIPSHGGVINTTVLAGGDSRRGFVVTQVPAADNMPLQVPKQACYYMRSGSDFVRIIHPVLAAMFGRRPQPILEIDIEFGLLPKAAPGSADHLIVKAFVVIQNRGVGIAENMYATVQVTAPEYCASSVASANDPHFQQAHHHAGTISVMAHSDRRFPPGTRVRALIVMLDFTGMVRGDLSILVAAGTSNGPPVLRDIRVSEKTLNDTLRDFVDPRVPRQLLAERVFGLTQD